MIKLLKVLKTNWIHLLGFYVSTYCSSIIFHLMGLERYRGYSLTPTLLTSLVSIPFLFFTYGLLFILTFYIAILLLDSIAFHFTNFKVITIMVIEWIVIIPPFVYWAFKEEYWLWLVLITSLLFTQLIRIKWIRGETR